MARGGRHLHDAAHDPRIVHVRQVPQEGRVGRAWRRQHLGPKGGIECDPSSAPGVVFAIHGNDVLRRRAKPRIEGRHGSRVVLGRVRVGPFHGLVCGDLLLGQEAEVHHILQVAGRVEVRGAQLAQGLIVVGVLLELGEARGRREEGREGHCVQQVLRGRSFAGERITVIDPDILPEGPLVGDGSVLEVVSVVVLLVRRHGAECFHELIEAREALQDEDIDQLPARRRADRREVRWISLIVEGKGDGRHHR